MRFAEWWQRLPMHINPYIIEVGSFRVGYYGLMYLVGFFTVYLLVVHRLKDEQWKEFRKETIGDVFVWLIVGLIAGARLGYVLFYNPGYYISHPLEIFLPFEFKGGGGALRYTGIAGMSYHGGAIGMAASAVIYCRRHKVGFRRLSDLFTPAMPLGYTFGRIGNFINGELWGRPTTAPWGMHFPLDGSGLLRHPSQLYEAFFEGIVLFAVLWPLRKKKRLEGRLLALYLIGYGFVRFFIEFVREPDAHLGAVAGPFSMGQVLCMIMMVAGIALMARRRARGSRTPFTGN